MTKWPSFVLRVKKEDGGVSERWNRASILRAQVILKPLYPNEQEHVVKVRVILWKQTLSFLLVPVLY